MGILDLLLGPILIGTVLAAFFYGIMVLQCYVYHLHYESDKAVIKFIVVFLLVCDTVSMIFNIVMTYDYLVTDFSNIFALALVNMGATAYPALTAITTAAVQGFYAWRIYVITGLRWLTLLICFGGVVTLLGGIGLTIAVTVYVHDFVAVVSELRALVLVWAVVYSITDGLIAASLVWYLHKNRAAFGSNERRLTRVFRVTIQTGLLSTAGVIGAAISFMVSDSTVYICITVAVGKFYTNSLMSTLNMRNGWGSADLTKKQAARSGDQLIPSGIHNSSIDPQIGTEMLRGPHAVRSPSSNRYDIESHLGVMDEVLDIRAMY